MPPIWEKQWSQILNITWWKIRAATRKYIILEQNLCFLHLIQNLRRKMILFRWVVVRLYLSLFSSSSWYWCRACDLDDDNKICWWVAPSWGNVRLRRASSFFIGLFLSFFRAPLSICLSILVKIRISKLKMRWFGWCSNKRYHKLKPESSTKMCRIELRPDFIRIFNVSFVVAPPRNSICLRCNFICFWDWYLPNLSSHFFRWRIEDTGKLVHNKFTSWKFWKYTTPTLLHTNEGVVVSCRGIS